MTVFRRDSILGCFVAVIVLLLLTATAAASAATLQVPGVSGTKGETITLPVTVDKADSLAGIKLELAYNPETLKFIRAAKTSHTANMLHVVNDKEPGRLVIVMAAARGFTAESAALVELTFELLRDVKKEENITVQITGAELMDQSLQRIRVNLQ